MNRGGSSLYNISEVEVCQPRSKVKLVQKKKMTLLIYTPRGIYMTNMKGLP